MDPEENDNTPTDEPTTDAPTDDPTPVVDESAAMLSAAQAKIASLTIELEAVKAELIATKAANWDLVAAAAPQGADDAVTDPENAPENDDTDTTDELEDFFGDRED